MSECRFDYIVVGGGSSGAAVASRLSEDSARSVLLLEAGGWDTRAEIQRVDVPSMLALWTAPWRHEIDWGYVTEPEPGLDGRSIPIARGKVIGGCSSVNALMWVRGNRADYDGWHKRGNTGWSYDEVLPYFKHAECYNGGDPYYRGDEGPIAVRDHSAATPVAKAFVAAAGELEFDSVNADYNGPRQDGFAFFYQTTRMPDGNRCSTATGYLRPAMNRLNLFTIVGAHVTKIDIAGGRARGVSYLHCGELQTAHAAEEVILSCGAFETPKLLMLSGLGPANELRRHGVPCVEDLPGVGGNLQDHLFVPVCYQCRREHPAAELISEAGLFAKTSLADPDGAPDLQFTFGTGKFLPDSAPEELWEGPGFTFAPVLLAPRSRGRVRLRNSDPLVPAVVEAGYLGAQEDTDVLLTGVELARELAHAPTFDEFRADELAPGKDAADRTALRRFVTSTATTLWHPVGTCRMGVDSLSVVDPALRVHGVDGLRIADASVMPQITSGNTNAPCVMIGEKAADLIKSHR